MLYAEPSAIDPPLTVLDPISLPSAHTTTVLPSIWLSPERVSLALPDLVMKESACLFRLPPIHSDQDGDSAVFPHTVNAIIRKALRRDAGNGGISAFRPQVGKVCTGVVVVITGVVEFIHPASAAVDEDAAVIQDYSTGMRTSPRGRILDMEVIRRYHFTIRGRLN